MTYSPEALKALKRLSKTPSALSHIVYLAANASSQDPTLTLTVLSHSLLVSLLALGVNEEEASTVSGALAEALRDGSFIEAADRAAWFKAAAGLK